MTEKERRDLKSGLKSALLEVIELWVSLKFGNEGKALMESLKEVEDIEKLKEVKELVMKAKTLSELRELLKGLI